MHDVWAADLSHFYGHKIDWGSVPAWAGSILSTISVLLALFIILRDRRRDRREQAQRIAISTRYQYTRAKSLHPLKIRITIHNTSDAAIWRPYLDIRPKNKWAKTRITRRFNSGLDGKNLRPIAPGESSSLVVYLDEYREALQIRGIFTDQKGVPWARDVETNDLREVRRAERLETSAIDNDLGPVT